MQSLNQQQILYLGAALVGAYILFKGCGSLYIKSKMDLIESKAKKVLAARNASTFDFTQYDKDLTTKVVNSTLLELKQMLEEGEVTSEQLVNIFGFRIYKIGRKLNLVTTELYQSALEKAKECDKLRKEGKAKGLLFGLPITIKDCQNMEGVRTTCGNMSMCEHVA